VPVSLTYNREDMHKTFAGGLMSFVCGIFIAFYAFVQLAGVFYSPVTNIVVDFNYDRMIKTHSPILETEDHNLFPMIGIRSAIPDLPNNITYDQNDAYDVKIVTTGFGSKNTTSQKVLETVPFVRCQTLIDNPDFKREFGPGELDENGKHKNDTGGIFYKHFIDILAYEDENKLG